MGKEKCIMGRYYQGDINGKFWVAVQSSDDADNFGVAGEFPPADHLHYHFTEDHLSDIEKGISKCKSKLADKKEKLDQFFKDNNGYNNEMIIEYFKRNFDLTVTEDDINTLLVYYARLALGEQILDCVKKNGECSFEAEC